MKVRSTTELLGCNWELRVDKAFAEDHISVYREKKDTTSLLAAAFLANFAVQFLLDVRF